MDDIAPALLETLRKAFRENLAKDQKVAALLEKIKSGKATYETAGDYAEQIGVALAKAFQEHLSGDALPDGRMYWNIADRVVGTLLEENHQLTAEAAAQVQQRLNTAAGIGLRAITAPLNHERVEGILDTLAVAEQYDDVAYILGEPVLANFFRNVVDNTLHSNVAFQGGAGLNPYVIRRAERKACKWCRALEGVYEYPYVPDDVYRRHDNCRCVVEHYLGSGKRKTIHSGKEGKRRYVKDEYGGYGLTKEARLQRAKEMEATAAERAKAAREKRIETWARKKELTAAGEHDKIEARKKIGLQPSATGKNRFNKGFTPKNLASHIEKHGAEYPGMSKEEYNRYALELIQSATSEDILGYRTSDGAVARYKISTNDYVKGYPKTGIATMYKPKGNHEKGMKYFIKKLNEEGIIDD